MNIELINTGTELMLGRVLNSHQQWLCAQFANLGHTVSRQVAIADAGLAIQQAVREGLKRADLIITTGGLGPTSDDITRDLIAELLGKKLVMDPESKRCIEDFFAKRNRPLPANTLKQALVPQGAIVLPNHFGTAPGLVMEIKGKRGASSRWLLMLPGPPRELRPMFSEQVIPFLQTILRSEKYICRTFRTTGLGESFVEEKIDAPLQRLIASGLELGYCARVGEVEVRLAARGKQAVRIVNAACGIVQQHIGLHIFGEENELLESVIVHEMTKRKLTLALAESCTGGLIANRVTNVSGASSVLMAGLVTYSNESKIQLLGVRPKTLDRFGAVSAETAREMADGARRKNKVDYAIAVTGIAGPTGGSPEKPVGTVFVALAAPDETLVQKFFNPYDRETFKFQTSQQAMDLLRRNLK